jgi:hypothetical protein
MNNNRSPDKVVLFDVDGTLLDMPDQMHGFVSGQ